ncbi:DEAD-box ATP-dependent RNA helicase 39 [Gracilaria domingensis]|nr:DEAD-box ATP-dependent RNA helicase 39 [Gracilaria domingensis]
MPCFITASPFITLRSPQLSTTFAGQKCPSESSAFVLSRVSKHRRPPTAVTFDVEKDAQNVMETKIPAATTPLFTKSTFAALGLSEEAQDHLLSIGISKPTGIQSRGIPPILGGVNVILGAATGSGKTFAYLLPVVQQLKQAEQMRAEGDPPLRVAKRPRALVLLPTRELAEQVEDVARRLSHVVKFRVLGTLAIGPGSMRKLRDRLNSPVDVMVTTTGRLLQLLQDRLIDVRFVKHVIIDEVDTLFDKGFETELKKILWWCAGANSDVRNEPQFVAAGATHPRAAEEIYKQVFPNAKRINVDLHKAPHGLEQRFVYVGPNTKLQELVSFLNHTRRGNGSKEGRMMVFCNTIDSCRFVDHFLREGGHVTSCIHGDIPLARRETEYESFRNGEKPLLICTDMAARGLDNLRVDHVVLFDFPNSAVDYLHRAGRTARAGAPGRVTSFVGKKDMRLARAIQRAGLEGIDALESARVAREEYEERKRREKEAMEQNEAMRAEEGGVDTRFKTGSRMGAKRARFGRGTGGMRRKRSDSSRRGR